MAWLACTQAILYPKTAPGDNMILLGRDSHSSQVRKFNLSANGSKYIKPWPPGQPKLKDRSKSKRKRDWVGNFAWPKTIEEKLCNALMTI